MCACLVRRSHGVREFPPEALAAVRAALATEAEVLNRAIADQAATAIEAKLSRKGSYQLGGVASCVATARKKHLPAGAEPAAAAGAAARARAAPTNEGGAPPPPPYADDPLRQRRFLPTLRRMWRGRAFGGASSPTRC